MAGEGEGEGKRKREREAKNEASATSLLDNSHSVLLAGQKSTVKRVARQAN